MLYFLQWVIAYLGENPARALIFSFLGLIFVGTTALTFPIAAQGEPVSFLTALFTATSASCVTGLSVVDISRVYSTFGQLVILCLIQIGGLGIITFSTFFISVVVGHMGLHSREVIQESFSQQPIENVLQLIYIILGATFLIECIGATFLYTYYRADMSMGILDSLYHAIFHSISAFCNAGFSLYSTSLVAFRTSWFYCLTIATLVVLGGIGFVVFYDLWQLVIAKIHGKTQRLAFHSRIVIRTTLLLIACGMVMFFVTEYDNTLRNESWPSKILISLFQSITPRTAGFNTVDFASLSTVTLCVTLFLMFVGGSPGSSAGGIKTSTAAVIAALFWARLKNETNVNIMHRRVDENIISKSISIFLYAVVVLGFFVILLLSSELGSLSHIQTRGFFLDLLFEATSAFGTVGLSTGITGSLTWSGQLVVIVLMFLGRVGPLTVAVAVARGRRKNYRYATEKFLVG